jgi:hypothetical protein
MKDDLKEKGVDYKLHLNNGPRDHMVALDDVLGK